MPVSTYAPSKRKHQQGPGPQDRDDVKSFDLFKKYISKDNNLELFKNLIARVDQQITRSEIVKNLVDSLCAQRSFNKPRDVSIIPNSLNALIDIIQTHSGDANNLEQNFQKLLGIKKDGSYKPHESPLSGANVFFPREIVESFSKEDGFNTLKQLLDLSGVRDDNNKNMYVSDLVKNHCFQNKADADNSQYYLNRAGAKTSEIKDNKTELLYDENTYKNSLALPNRLGPKEIKNLIIHFGSIKKVEEILAKRKNKEDVAIPDAIHGGRLSLGEATDDYDFLREVLQKGNKNLLNELIDGSMPLISQDQIFRSLDFKGTSPNRFEPIREAFNKNQDLDALNCLALLFSKISENQRLTILSSLIPNIQDQTAPNQDQTAPNQDNFLTGLLSGNYDSAKMLIDLTNKEGFGLSIKSSLSYFINRGAIDGRGNTIELLNMIADNGPLSLNFMLENNLTQTSQTLEGDNLFNELVSRGQIYTSQGSPSMLLNQNNPAALAFFFEKTGGVANNDNSQMITKLYNYLDNPANQANKNSDACQNSLMFLLKRNPTLAQNFERFLITNDPNNPNNSKKIDDKKLIRAICDSIFPTNGKSLADDFKELKIYPLLEAGKIFKHFDNKEVRAEKNKITLSLEKSAFFKIINKVTKKEKELFPEVSELIALKLVGYEIGENNPSLSNDDKTKNLTSKLNDALLDNGLSPLRKLKPKDPATSVGPTEGNAVSQNTQGPTPS
jgi:hypothetical protein